MNRNMVLSSGFAEDFQNDLREMLEEEDASSGLGDGIRRVDTFEEAMVLTSDKGLVVTFADGSQAQVTITALVPRAELT